MLRRVGRRGRPLARFVGRLAIGRLGAAARDRRARADRSRHGDPRDLAGSAARFRGHHADVRERDACRARRNVARRAPHPAVARRPSPIRRAGADWGDDRHRARRRPVQSSGQGCRRPQRAARSRRRTKPRGAPARQRGRSATPPSAHRVRDRRARHPCCGRVADAEWTPRGDRLDDLARRDHSDQRSEHSAGCARGGPGQPRQDRRQRAGGRLCPRGRVERRPAPCRPGRFCDPLVARLLDLERHAFAAQRVRRRLRARRGRAHRPSGRLMARGAADARPGQARRRAIVARRRRTGDRHEHARGGSARSDGPCRRSRAPALGERRLERRRLPPTGPGRDRS